QSPEKRPGSAVGEAPDEEAAQDIDDRRGRLEERELCGRGAEFLRADGQHGPEDVGEPVVEEAGEAVSPEAHEAGILGLETLRGKTEVLPLAWRNGTREAISCYPPRDKISRRGCPVREPEQPHELVEAAGIAPASGTSRVPVLTCCTT